MPNPIALMTSDRPAKPTSPEKPTKQANVRPQMDKAKLSLYDAAAESGGPAGKKLGEVVFQFNPKEVTITKSAKWERKPSKQAPKASPVQFLGADPSKMTLEMFFDATAAQDGSVVTAVEALLACCVPTKESHGKKKATPPIVVLHWGAISSFPAVVTSVSAKFTLFSSTGTPIRAVCSVTMEEMPGEAFRKQNPTSGSYEVRRVHRTVAGDSLASVAFNEYGSPTSWRPLAAFNGIDDPLRVPTGTVLMLPSPEELGAARLAARAGAMTGVDAL
jgi:nucleoid-associated protein YgaU